MKKLYFKKAFSKYSVSLSMYLSRFAYFLYKGVRTRLSTIFPLKVHEKYRFEDHRFRDDSSSDMPMGFNYSLKKSEEGFINLEYIDLFDYLPKEDLVVFKKALRKFACKNKLSPFGPFHSVEDDKRIDSMGRYVDWWTFSNLCDVRLTRNKYLEQFTSQVAVSLRNLSPSFLVVKFRFYINSSFNEEFNAICKRKFLPYSDVCRQVNIPWYKPQKFGRSMFRGDNAREKELYALIAKLKWKALLELKRYFVIHFEHNEVFPPAFETYSTNIRPNKSRENDNFWRSVMLAFPIDYAPKYNVCVCWRYERDQHEGLRLSAYCGGDYSDTDCLAEIVKHDLSDSYAVYLTANTLNEIAERDIAKCNKKISKAIRKAKASLVLKVRLNVERTLYYSYRFISEFTGNTIVQDDDEEFRSPNHPDGSITANCQKNISEFTAETKKRIDTLLHILDDAAEYGSSKSNLRLQGTMTIITVMSLIVAFVAIFDLTFTDIKSMWNTLLVFLQIK